MKNFFEKLEKDYFLKDLLITFIGQFFVMILAFVMNKVISNIYSVSDFGTYNIIRRATSVISFFLVMSMGITLPKYISESKAKNDIAKIQSYFISGFVIIICTVLLAFVCSSLLQKEISMMLFGKYNLYSFVTPTLLFSFGSTLVTYAFSYYRGIDNYYKYNLINIIMQLGQIIIVFFVSDNLHELYIFWAVFFVIYGGYLIVNIFLKEFKCKISRDSLNIVVVKELLVYSLPRIPGELILFSYNLIPLLLIQHRFGKIEVAFFSVALSICSMITPLFSITGTILLTFVSKNRVLGNSQIVNNKIRILGLLYLIFSLLVGIFILFFGKIVVISLFNANYVKALPLIKITIVSIFPNSIYLLLRNPIDGISKIPYNSISLSLSFVIYIVLLLNSKNITWCAISLTISYTILGILSLLFWSKLINNKNEVL